VASHALSVRHLDLTSPLGQLKAALLLVESALPIGSVDENGEDKWGLNFDVCWRSAVCTAETPRELMQCQLLLEHGVRSTWLQERRGKVMASFPSRTQSMRLATLGLVAARLWAFDGALRYKKVSLRKDKKADVLLDAAASKNGGKKKWNFQKKKKS
jgi:hypothetical protein